MKRFQILQTTLLLLLGSHLLPSGLSNLQTATCSILSSDNSDDCGTAPKTNSLTTTEVSHSLTSSERHLKLRVSTTSAEALPTFSPTFLPSVPEAWPNDKSL